MSGIGDWEIEKGGTLGEGVQASPVQYPRSNENRGQSDDNNKGGASRTDSIERDRELNTTGNEESPRTTEDVNYEVGPYPSVDDVSGVDEGDGASR